MAPLYDLLSVTPYLPTQPQSMGPKEAKKKPRDIDKKMKKYK